jgi:small-conductance mechanosensitive channel
MRDKARAPEGKIWLLTARAFISLLVLAFLIFHPYPYPIYVFAIIFFFMYFIWAATDLFMEFFFRRFLISRLQAEIPDILIGVFKAIVLLTALVFILRHETGIRLTPILTGSAIVTVIIGFAFQDTLGNLISGLALHFSSPYRIGDWIKIGGVEGKIARMEWRSTTLVTRTNDSIVIPHSTMAKNDIYNFSSPSSRHVRELKIPFAMKISPDKIYEVLTFSASQIEGVLKDPPPSVSIAEFGNDLITYSLQIWTEDFDHLPDIMGNLARKIWYQVRREEIPMGIEGLIRTASETEKKRSIDFLKSLPLFSSMDEKNLESLLERGKLNLYGSKEFIIKEGETNQDFFVLMQGEAVAAKNEAVFHTYKPGGFFGEMALITGEPRKATIQAKGEALVLVFTKEELAPFLESHPGFLEHLSNAIAERLKELPREELEDLETKEEKESETPGTFILKRIKLFFLGEK